MHCTVFQQYLGFFLNFSDAVLDAVGRKTDVRLLKILHAEVKPNHHEAKIVVC